MTKAYYNEWNPQAADWIERLIAAKLIPAGDVDTRSIADVSADDLKSYTQAHFFAGIAGWPYALRLAGWPDDKKVWTGSCPCQPFSNAGKRKGTDDDRHLWPEFYRIIKSKNGRPPVIFGEQVASADGRRWLAGVRADMERVDYAFGAADLCAPGVGSPNLRQRLHWVADAHSPFLQGQPPARQQQVYEFDEGVSSAADANVAGLQGRPVMPERRNERPIRSRSLGERMVDADQIGHNRRWSRSAGRAELASASSAIGFWTESEWLLCSDGKSRRIEPGTFPLAHGIPIGMGAGLPRLQRLLIGHARTYRKIALSGYGNSINPWVAKEFILAYGETIR